jgi:hypothetical protein
MSHYDTPHEAKTLQTHRSLCKMYMQYFECIQTVLASGNFAHTNFYNEVSTLGSVRRLKANSPIRNLFRTKTETRELNVAQSVRLSLCSGEHLVREPPTFQVTSLKHTYAICFLSARPPSPP